jgi:hypothetical protein
MSSYVFLGSKTMRARRAYPCSYCRQPAVQPGESYTRETYVMDGSAYDWLTCAACSGMRGKVIKWMEEAWEGIAGEDFAEWAQGHPDDPDAVAFLARAYGDRS